MKKSSSAVLSCLVTFAALSLANVQGAPTTITNDGTTTPTITPPGVGAFFGYNDVDYDAGNGFTNNGTDPGQTFLTPSTSSLFDLNSITLQESNGSNFNTSEVLTLGVFSVSGTTLTSLGTENYTFSSVPGDGGYFTLDTSALGLVLNGNTEYAFSLANPDGGEYLGLVSSANGDTTTGLDSYSNGVAIDEATPIAAGNTESFNTPTQGGTYDRAFSVQLSAAPEPSTWAMMIGGFALVGGLLRLRRLSS